MAIDAHREPDPVLVEERFERGGSHGLVVLEDGVQAQHGDVVAEGLRDASRLG